ncbi:hypothetical protein LF1_34970 [Rubripirellula obstinata]|uniref:Uncharacterized protein n=1 Tax=Rubripirellula obstinata TaxID=406547 RepID=A0A5B1CM30_9BACT|nr:hypothetical protein LF1_34970 [Rubripirellula obstinata]
MALLRVVEVHEMESSILLRVPMKMTIFEKVKPMFERHIHVTRKTNGVQSGLMSRDPIVPIKH